MLKVIFGALMGTDHTKHPVKSIIVKLYKIQQVDITNPQ